MYIINTAFDRSGKSKPLASVIFNNDTGEIDFRKLYLFGTGQSLWSIDEHKKYIRSLLLENEVVLNNFKGHIKSFNLPLDVSYRLYELPDTEPTYNQNIDELQKQLVSNIIDIKKNPHSEKWQMTLARASQVYEILERSGVMFEGTRVYPIYETNTFSGRSKTSGFNIQGTEMGQSVHHIYQDYDIFICVDWMSADMRMMSILSNDETMQQSFIKSDPYTYIADQTGKDRSTCKIELLKGIYSLNQSPILNHYQRLKKWVDETYSKINQDGFSASILGRQFYLDDNNHKGVFNAMVQGSVAHAMHNTIHRLHQRIPDNIITELHDSVILACKRNMIKTIINEAIDVMIRPFAGLLEHNHTFPLRVNIGKKWREWQLYKEYRV